MDREELKKLLSTVQKISNLRSKNGLLIQHEQIHFYQRLGAVQNIHFSVFNTENLKKEKKQEICYKI